MHHHRFLSSVFLLSAALAAQSPLSMPFTADNGLGAGAQVFFDLDVTAARGITIASLDVDTGATAVGSAGAVEIYTGPTTYVGNETNGAAWTLAGSGALVAQGNGVPTPVCLSPGVFLAQGRHGIAVRHRGVHVRYTNGTGSNQTGSTAEVTLTAGASQALPFASPPITPRVFNGNIHYLTGNAPVGTCAAKVAYGAPCYIGSTTFYEPFAGLAAFDLGGSSGGANVVELAAIGPAGYMVLPGAPAFRAPAGAPVLDNATPPAPMDDDSMSGPLALPFAFPFPSGSTNVVHACANGYLVLGPTTDTTGDYAADLPYLLAGPPRLCPAWSDLNPARNLPANPAAGIYFDVDPNGNTAYVTWLDVGEFATAAPGATSLTFQVALHRNGSIEFRYRTMSVATGTSGCITGFSKGANGGTPAVDPGPVDISAAMPFPTPGPDSLPLLLDTDLPRLGGRLGFATHFLPSPSGIGATIVSLGGFDPGIELSAVGMPGCFQHVDLAGAASFLLVGSPTVAVSVTLPANPAYAGQRLFVQSVAFVPGANPLGVITSNGVALTIGH